MKHLFRYRTTLLLLFLILLAQRSQAQGTERALEAFWSFILILQAVAGLALLCLVIFVVKRTKVMAVISGIFGFVLLLLGLWLAFILDRDNTVGLASVGSVLQMGGALNLALVFIFMLVFPKQQALHSAKAVGADAQPVPDPGTGRTVKWVTALFILSFFYSLLGAVGFLGSMSMLNTYRIRMQDIFLIAMQFLMVLVLLAGLVLFMRRRRAGWNLLLFTNMYGIAGTLLFTVRNVLFQHNQKLHMSAFFFESQGIIMLFLVLCAWLLTRPDVLILFAITKKSRNLSLLFSLATAVAWIFLNQLIVGFLALF